MEIVTVVDRLVKNLEENPVIDVGKGSEAFIGCTRKELGLACQLMYRKMGYHYGTLVFDKPGTNEKMYIEVLGRKNMTAADVFKHRFEVAIIK